MAEPPVLINASEVPAAEAKKSLLPGEQSRDYLRSQPGCVDTALRQAVTPTADFQFVNVSRWPSAQEFLAATESPGFRQAAAGLAAYRPHPRLYRVART